VAIGAVTQAGQIVMSAGGDSWTKTLQMDSDWCRTLAVLCLCICVHA